MHEIIWIDFDIHHRLASLQIFYLGLYDNDLYFQGTQLLIFRKRWAFAQSMMMTFINVYIRHQMKPQRMLYFVTLTCIFEIKHSCWALTIKMCEDIAYFRQIFASTRTATAMELHFFERCFTLNRRNGDMRWNTTTGVPLSPTDGTQINSQSKHWWTG